MSDFIPISCSFGAYLNTQDLIQTCPYRDNAQLFKFHYKNLTPRSTIRPDSALDAQRQSAVMMYERGHPVIV